MGNWSHFGIDRNSVKEQYNKILDCKFPEPPENDILYDLFTELVELDGYIMGIVSSYLKCGVVDRKKLKCDAEFLRIYSQINNSSKELDEILKYKKELDKLILLFFA